MTPLCELANKYGTDKGPKFHWYTPAYHAILGPRREEFEEVLELGVLEGGSLRMWRDYFWDYRRLGRPVVVGVDHLKNWMFEEEGIRTVCADCSTTAGLEIAAAAVKSPDLIVDDASHKAADQERALRYLTLRHSPEIYVIEDAEVEDLYLDPPEVDGYSWFTVNARAPSVGVAVVYVRDA